MNHQLQITTVRTFSNGQYLGFTANTPNGAIEGVVWEQAMTGPFTVGAQLLVEMGPEAEFGEYKGKTRLNIRKGAKISAANTGFYQQPQQAAQQPPQQAYQPPAYQAPIQQQAPPTGAPTGQGEMIVKRQNELIAMAYFDLKQRGLPEEVCVQGAIVAPRNVSAWFFGEKGC